MDDVSLDPRTFVEEHLVARAAELRERIGDVTSIGSVVFRIPGVDEWTLRLVSGELVVARGVEDDVLLQVTVLEADFGPLIARSQSAIDTARLGSTELGALRVLSLDPRAARGLRHLPGSVLFSVDDGDAKRSVLFTPGRGRADVAAADCTIACRLDDFLAVQTGTVRPTELFAQGKLRLSGNVQLALALAGALT